jgi:hypothetical protein
LHQSGEEVHNRSDKQDFNFTCIKLVSFSDCSAKPIDLGIVLDTSGSITDGGNEQNWPLLLQFVASIVEQFEIGPSKTRVSLVVFSTSAYMVFPLNAYYDKQAIVDRIMVGDFHEGGNTNMSVSTRTIS